MEKRWKLSAGTGGAVAAVSLLFMLWLGSNPDRSDALARLWIHVSSTNDTGIPGGEALGMSRQLTVESYGSGKSELKRRRFLARQGQVLVLDYQATIVRGFLVFSVDRFPFFADELWRSTLRADQRETVRLAIPKTGVYQVTMTHYQHTGSYRVGWRLENP